MLTVSLKRTGHEMQVTILGISVAAEGWPCAHHFQPHELFFLIQQRLHECSGGAAAVAPAWG